MAPKSKRPAEDEPDDDDDDEPAKPNKKNFRTRAHSNPLNENDFWHPINKEDVPWAEYFPAYFPGSSGTAEEVKIVDVGCGYGSLLVELAQLFPDTLMMGIELRPKVVEFVQKRVLALRHEQRKAKPEEATVLYDNLWAVHNNAMRYMPNFYGKGQLEKVLFCFADPHFKKKNHRRRVVSQSLLAEYAYCMKDGGLVYIITDVAELMEWFLGHFNEFPLFERLPNAAVEDDPVIPLLLKTDEGMKVRGNNGNIFIAVYKKHPTAVAQSDSSTDLELCAALSSKAGYTPQEGGERRGKTW